MREGRQGVGEWPGNCCNCQARRGAGERNKQTRTRYGQTTNTLRERAFICHLSHGAAAGWSCQSGRRWPVGHFIISICSSSPGHSSPTHKLLKNFTWLRHTHTETGIYKYENGIAVSRQRKAMAWQQKLGERREREATAMATTTTFINYLHAARRRCCHCRPCGAYAWYM